MWLREISEVSGTDVNDMSRFGVKLNNCKTFIYMCMESWPDGNQIVGFEVHRVRYKGVMPVEGDEVRDVSAEVEEKCIYMKGQNKNGNTISYFRVFCRKGGW